MVQSSARPGAASRPVGPADAGIVASRLRDLHLDARTELDHSDAFELLVATVLSAQTTDVRVNQVTPALFAAWPDPEALAGAADADVTEIVRPLGMGATRARRIIGLAQRLVTEHGGEVPDSQTALEALPGVGRKTAHVLRGAWFGHSLLAVDTHVGRLSRRLGWTEQTDPAQGRGRRRRPGRRRRNRQPRRGPHGPRPAVILHGRRVCTARAPDCGSCVLVDVCPRIGLTQQAGVA